MSTYGSAIVVDAASAAGAGDALARLCAQADFVEDDAVITGPEPCGEWHRLAVYVSYFAVSAGLGDELATDAGRGRVLAADDFDEFGARFTAWRATDGVAIVVYRVTIAGESEGDDAPPDVVGPAAATDLARLWAVDTEPLVAIDADRESLADELGVIGGPFPWFDALGVAWPGG